MSQFPTSNTSQKLYTWQFTMLCLSAFLFFTSFNLIIPELPDYISSLGGEDYKGLIIGLFTITAGLSRPFSGKLADTIGRVPVMFFGVAVCFIVGFLYPILSTVIGFLLLRFIHGLSTGFNPTGVSAYVADIIPDSRRGEAMGILGLSNSIGIAVGPSIGGWLAQHYSIEVIFYISSFIALLSGIVVLGMKETLKNRVKFHPKLLKISWKEVVDWQVLSPALVMLLTAFSFGTMLTIIPDLSKHLGIENKGLFFSVFTLASVAVRIIAGKLSDKIGRVQFLRVSTFIVMLALSALALTNSFTLFILSSVLLGIGIGINSPIIFAWTIDLSDTERRGRSMATLYIGMEAGITLGSFITGYLYANQSSNFPLVFFVSAAFSLAAFIYLIFKKS